MIIAIRNNEIYKENEWQDCFKGEFVSGYDISNKPIYSQKIDLTLEPYNYQLVNVEVESIDDMELVKNIKYSDFDCTDGIYTFNYSKYRDRIALDKSHISKLQYDSAIVFKIRERYSLNDELAILRQRDIKPHEWEDYNAYCEEYKALIKNNAKIE